MLERIICPFCGSSDLKFINENEYHCQSCGEKLYEKEDKLALEEKILKSLNAQDEKYYANAKKNLWATTHEKYLSNENIKHWCNEVKKYSPDDFFANFYNIVTFSDIDTICNYLLNYINNDDFDFANEVIRYLTNIADNSRLIQLILAIIESIKPNLDSDTYNKYIDDLNVLAYNLDEGTFDTIISRDVFVCYSSKDIKVVTDIVNYLEENEIKCFCAQRNLRHGKGAKENYVLELQRAMHNCKCILFISSLNSRTRSCDALDKEIRYLIENEPKKGRIEYVIDQTKYSETKKAALLMLEQYFEGQEYCTNKEDLIKRINKYISGYEKQEDENNDLKKQIEELKKLVSEQNKVKAKEENVEPIKQEVKVEKQEKKPENKKDNAEPIKQKLILKPTIKVRDAEDFEIVDHVLVKYKGKSKEVEIPPGVTTIGEKAFYENNDIMYVTIPSGVTTIGKAAFRNCNSLLRVILPNTLTKIESFAFRDCERLFEVYNLSNLNIMVNDTNFTAEHRRKMAIHKKITDKTVIINEKNFIFITVRNIAYIIGYEGNDTNVILPDALVYEGKTITDLRLLGYAFYNCRFISSITLSNSITFISMVAFEGLKLNELIKNDNAYYIGSKDNPYFCLYKSINSKITNCKINENTKIIAGSAFENCSLITSIEIPNNVISIGTYAFDGCSKLATVKLPNKLTRLEKGTFSDCESLENIVIPDTLKAVLSYNFWGQNNLKYNEYENALYLGSVNNPYLILIKAKSTTVKNLKVHENCKIICPQAFINNSLTSIILPKNLTHIGQEAFYYVKQINYCGNEKEWQNLVPTNLIKNIFDSLFDVNKLKIEFNYLPVVDKKVEATKPVKEEAKPQQNVVKPQQNVVKPTSTPTAEKAVVDVKNYEVLVAGGNKKIEKNTFKDYNCKELVIAEGVEIIEREAFSNFPKLKKIHISSTVKNLGYDAFHNCSNLEIIEVDKNNRTFNSKNHCNAIIETFYCTIVLGCKNTRLEWGIGRIGKWAFYHSSIEIIFLPDGITSIEDSAFEDCKNLKTVIIPKSVKEIGKDAFKGCENATIYCEHKKPLIGLPKGFSEDWLGDAKEVKKSGGPKVVWNYKK